jgi:hypothetical protein
MFLIVFGTIQSIGAAACVAFSVRLAASGGSDLEDVATTVFAAIVFILGVASIGAGAGILNRRSWARWVGVGVSIVAVIVWSTWVAFALALGAPLLSRYAEILIIVFHVLAITALTSAGEWFTAENR